MRRRTGAGDPGLGVGGARAARARVGDDGRTGGGARPRVGRARRGPDPSRGSRGTVHGPTRRAVEGEVDAETWARRVELLLALPAYVDEAGGWKQAARALEVPIRTLARWIATAREVAALGRTSPGGDVVVAGAEVKAFPFQGEAGALARAQLADWLDARRAAS